MPYGPRTIIETEYGAPAVKDAIERLGYEFNNYNIPMKTVIARWASQDAWANSATPRAKRRL